MPMFSPQTGGLASALQSQGGGGLLQRLLGSSGQSGFGQRLTDLLDPRVALPAAGEMIAGRTPAAGIGAGLASMGIGLGKLGETRKLDAEKQRTKDYLTKAHPELAQMVDMGLPIEDAWKEALKLDHGDSADSTSGIKEYEYARKNGFNGSFVDWQNQGKEAKSPNVVELFDEQGQPYKAIWNGETGSFDRMGGSKTPPAKAPTEQVVRNRQLYKVVAPEAANLLGNGTTPGKFDALASTASQAGDILGNLGKSVGAGDLSGYTTSGEYQSAKNSLKTIVASYLYSVSGATANPGEVETQTNVLMPKPGEDPTSVADKKARIKTMVEAIHSVAGDENGVMSPTGTTSGGWTVEEQ